MKKLFLFVIFIFSNSYATSLHTDQENIDNFIHYMKEWGYFYPELAGAKILSLEGDEEVKEGTLLVNGGDWAVYDIRGYSGVYGVSHENGEIFPITLYEPEKYKVDVDKSPIDRKVDAITLMYRFQWFSDLFITWSHRDTANPFYLWNNFEEVTQDYLEEKSSFIDDPHLALYWLMHFGFSLDTRYEEVKAIIRANNLEQQLEFINYAISFFDHYPPFRDIDFKESYYQEPGELDKIYLKRRAYLIFVAHSYKYRGGETALPLWWMSIKLYPDAEEYTIRRIRWLGNNLDKYKQWNTFDTLLANEKNVEKISLLSYVHTLNPNTKNKADYAHQFLQELIQGKEIWKYKISHEFARAMLWSIKDFVEDKVLLAQAVKIYFAEDSISKEYQDITMILNADYKDDNIKAVRIAIEKIKQDQAIDTVLSNQQPEVIFRIIENIDNKTVAGKALYYLITHAIPDKENTIINLFTRFYFSDYEILKIFKDMPLPYLNNENDPNIAILQKIFLLPVTAFKSEYDSESAREGAAIFFLNTVHWENNFQFFMKVIEDTDNQYPAHSKQVIFTHLLTKEYDSKINSTHLFSKTQIETMLDTTAYVLKTHDFNHEYYQEAIRTIYYCDHPLAKDWLLKHYNNRIWLLGFFRINTGLMIADEINEAIESALEFIQQKK